MGEHDLSSLDRDLGMRRAITRRDFLNGVAIAVGAAIGGDLTTAAAGLEAGLLADAFAQDQPGYYPPALTGMRGSHQGSFEVSQRCETADSGEPRGNRLTRRRSTTS